MDFAFVSVAGKLFVTILYGGNKEDQGYNRFAKVINKSSFPPSQDTGHMYVPSVS